MHDLLLHSIFYIFAGLTVFAAFMTVTQNNPVRCVLFLVLAFFTSSVLWILVAAEFLALILVLVYVGAVMTLFLFVVMMLNIDVESMHTHVLRYMPFGVLLVALLVGLLLMSLPIDLFERGTAVSVALQDLVARQVMPAAVPKALSNTEALGLVLYTDYLFAFELAAVMLLVAIIAAITLAHRSPKNSKQQNIVKQIRIRRADRISLIQMQAEQERWEI